MIPIEKVAMKKILFYSILLSIIPFAAFSDDAVLIKKKGTLLFEDKFERDESVPDKEDIGGGWTTNSAWRAKGQKQVDLDKGVMHVSRLPVADHSVAIFHDVAFQNGAVALKFKLAKGEDFGLDFVDREFKEIHAGHLCMAKIQLNRVTIMDSKTGHMKNDIRNRRKKDPKNKEIIEFLKTKRKFVANKIEVDKWHDLLVVIEGDIMRISVDGKQVLEFQSEGIAHPTKRMITLAVNKGAAFDDVKVWAMDGKK